MKIQLFLGIILSTFCLIGCEQQPPVTFQSAGNLGTTVINYGTAFGMCMGPCKKELVFEGGGVTYTIYYNGGRGEPEGAPDVIKEALASGHIDALLKNIDFAAFVKMPERIGCPDCADGGSEWVQITKDDMTHRVTFEHGQNVPEIAELLKLLRGRMSYFENSFIK